MAIFKKEGKDMDIILAVMELIFAVLLFFVAGMEQQRPHQRWRLCYLLPFLTALLCSVWIVWDNDYLGIYVGAVLFLGCLYMETTREKRRLLWGTP